jgi:6-phosphofructokinase
MCDAGVKALGVPDTIDNDIPGTELAIGVDTAIDTAAETIERITGAQPSPTTERT